VIRTTDTCGSSPVNSGKDGEVNRLTKAEELLEGAYGLKSSADNIEYYKEFAPIYDQQFAAAMDYTYPSVVAGEFLKHGNSNIDSVLDVGCGTGLVAERLAGLRAVDGVDISTDMLAVAEQKDLYRALYCQDLNQGAGKLPGDYAGVVSAGTFTHGHLGPEVITLLLDIGASGCLYCLGINAAHYENDDFQSVFNRLQEAGAITDFQSSTHSIFNTEGGQHAEDRAQVTVFYKNRS